MYSLRVKTHSRLLSTLLLKLFYCLQIKTSTDLDLVYFDLKGHRSTISPKFDRLTSRSQTFAQTFLSINGKTFVSTFCRRSIKGFKDIAHLL